MTTSTVPKNELFPLWHTANIVLPQIINAHFGPHISYDGDTINISFFDDEMVYAIPEEDRDAFSIAIDYCLNCLYARIPWYRLTGRIQRFAGEPLTPQTLARIEQELNETLALFLNNEHFRTLQEYALAWLRVPPYLFYLSSHLHEFVSHRLWRLRNP
ncbi:MAG: hypothetical protein K6T83_03655 [Alicyclobacillus sp.]|nr:hypothetical protein [Alicyclobacillus sp.]